MMDVIGGGKRAERVRRADRDGPSMQTADRTTGGPAQTVPVAPWIALQRLIGNQATAGLARQGRLPAAVGGLGVGGQAARRALAWPTVARGARSAPTPAIQRVVVNVPFSGGKVTGVEVSQDRPSVTLGKGGSVGAQGAHVTSHLVIRVSVMSAMEGKPWNLALLGLHRLFNGLVALGRAEPGAGWLMSQIEQAAELHTTNIEQYIKPGDGTVVKDIPADERSGVLSAFAKAYIELRARLPWTAINQASTKTGESGHANALAAVTLATDLLTSDQAEGLVTHILGLFEFQPKSQQLGSDPKMAGNLAARHLAETFVAFPTLRAAWYDQIQLLFGNEAWKELKAAAPTTSSSWTQTNPNALDDFAGAFISMVKTLKPLVLLSKA